MTEPSNEIKKVAERHEIQDQYKWNLRDIYPDDESFEKDLKNLDDFPAALESYRGRLSESAAALLEFFQLREEAFGVYEKVISYARLHKDQDSRVTKYQALAGRAQNSGALIFQAMSWAAPELLTIPWETLEEWMDENEPLAVYRHHLDDEFRLKQHILSPESEHVLALSANFSAAPSQIFHAFNDADAGRLFPAVTDDEGNRVQISPSRYSAFIETGSPRLRRESFQALFSTYENYKTTIAAVLKSQVDKAVFFSRARKYDSALAAALSGDNVPPDVYTGLISSVKDKLPVVHRYMALRKKVLELDELHIYDMHCPMFPGVTEKYPYDETRRIITDSLQPLGDEYVHSVQTAFDSNWIDVYENAGKYNGAYNWGSYKVHPYILLNHQETLNDVFTIAHEMGHALHSHLTARRQPYIYGDYSIFVAEVASTLNEALLMDYFLKNTNDRLKKLNLLGQYISNINGTVVAQTLFAEFELTIHQMAENNQPITFETLSDTYFRLLQEYWGGVLTYDDLYRYTWCRIPHFYANFYVYKYATSFAASTALAQKILAGDKTAREKYLEFLSSGSSHYPIDLLKIAGVDMTTPAPVAATMELYSNLIGQAETLLSDNS
ncbi:MAG: oligoendopeptidase F [FCB group bacterium]|nr:oligoendopeptidase F [FCB group bacterium]